MKKVAIAISGGVDSAGAALLLKKEGYQVLGVNLSLASSSEEGRTLCQQLNIPYYHWDFQKEFKKEIIEETVRCYQEGLTPNPCSLCNKKVKLGLLLEKACQELKVDYIATGHYARIKKQGELYHLFQARDKIKDQSYFLAQINQKILQKLLLPLGDYKKEEVRDIIQTNGLSVTDRKESQDLCFVDGSFSDFLKKYLPVQKGEIRNDKNELLGYHDGAYFYTLGQHLSIGGSGPYYVAQKDIKNNLLIAVNDKQSPLLFKKTFDVFDMNWILDVTASFSLPFLVQTRYHSSFSSAILERTTNKVVKVILQEPRQDIAPGQIAAFYRGEELLGGGIIKNF